MRTGRCYYYFCLLCCLLATTCQGISHRRKKTIINMSASSRSKKPVVATGNTSKAVTSVQGGGSAAAAVQAAANNKLRGRLLLIFVAFLYGTLNVCLRQLSTMPDPPSASALSVCRGWLTTLCFLPSMLQKSNNGDTKTTLSRNNKNQQRPLSLVALEFALWNFGAFGLLIVGLQQTGSAIRASFLTQTSVVITPLISMMAGQKVRPSVWLGCCTALAGLVILSTGGGGDVVESAASTAAASSAFGAGDLLILGGAFCWSAYLFRFSTIGIHYPEVRLQASLATFRSILYTIWFLASAASDFDKLEGSGGWLDALVQQWPGWKSPSAWIILVFSAIGPGALASVLLQQGQKEVSASEANVILCGEPVFTAICALIVLGEVTSSRENMGGLLILLAAMLASGSLDGILSSRNQKAE